MTKENLIPEAREFVNLTDKGVHKETENRDYGHAAANLAEVLRGVAELGESQDKQRNMLERQVAGLVEEFGPNIIPFLRDELKLLIEE